MVGREKAEKLKIVYMTFKMTSAIYFHVILLDSLFTIYLKIFHGIEQFQMYFRNSKPIQ